MCSVHIFWEGDFHKAVLYWGSEAELGFCL